eukprot:CAMPEP_0170525064 /NCGR_PEP_ID=MMETSP0209-20121228/10521_1 /TAXON_ID=665100 ORGANISM="Litonotus pictus, Strain P1" /NCGR_SAMPLE_ID=MMETSP0209 /ASSEMBLY_ACC=CAM_ASM_000301 /LENGTH=1170 /DNA_ID=CAMNT_0010814107 /DNA_START=170 /DNA_END=3679 /DNA_ORIENTATION=+
MNIHTGMNKESGSGEKVVNLSNKLFKTKNMLGSIFKLDTNYVKSTMDDIKIMTNENFEVFNYQLVYFYYNKHLQDFVTKPELITMLGSFNKNNEQVNIKTNYLQNNFNILSNINKKLLYLLIKYEKDKQSLSDSTFIQNLDEQNIMHRSSYRYLFMKTLFFLSTNENFNGRYTKQAFWNIFRLLHHDTGQTQVEILKLYKKDHKFVNFEYLEAYFLENFLSLIFSNSNPTNTPDRNDYFQAMTIIKIFKYLCEEHNQFFQTVFFSYLNFQYTKVSDNNYNYGSIDSTESAENYCSINLFDYMMCILSKIVVLTNWTKAKYDSEDKELAYYFDIYFVVVELLIEIIQGTTKSNLETLLKINNSYTTDKKNTQQNTTHPNGLNQTMNYTNLNINKDTINYTTTQMSFDNNYLLSCLQELKSLLFYDKTNSVIIYNARLAAINFILAFLEEPNTPINVINNISHVYTPNLVFESMSIIMKKLYIRLNNKFGTIIHNPNKVDPEQEEKKPKKKVNTGSFYMSEEQKKKEEEMHLNQDEKGINESQHNLLIFNNKIASFYEYHFFDNPNFAQENPEFELCNRLYHYVFLLQKEFKNEEAINIFNTVEMYKSAEAELNGLNYQKLSKKDKSKKKDDVKEGDSPKKDYSPGFNTKNLNGFTSITSKNHSSKNSNKEIIIDQQFYENYYLILFFNKITRSVIVSIKEEQSRVVYTINPLVNYLSVNTKNDFYLNVDRSNRYTKLFALNENTNYFYEEVLYNESNMRGNFLFQFLNKFDYKLYEQYLFILTLGINILTVISLENTPAYPGITTGINNIVPRSPTTEVYYDNDNIEFAVKILFILVIVLNGVGVICWLMTKFPLYYRIEKIKMFKKMNYQNSGEEEEEDTAKKNIEEEELTWLNKLFILFNTFYYKSEINSLITNIFCSLISQLNFPYATFLYAFQMLMIINLNDSMKNIQKAVSMRGKQLIAIGIFSIIIFDVFGNVGYFWLRDFYEMEIEVTGYPLKENLCGSLLYCFLTNVRYGFLTEGGVGEFMNKTYYEPGNTIFAGLFINNLLNFLFIKVAMLYISLSLVIDTYAELREESYKLQIDKNDKCYICGASRDKLEKDNIRFDNHTKEDHNMWEYADYLIGLKFVDIQETNAINSFVIEKLQSKSISWFPSYKGEGDEKNEDEDEEK